MNKSDLIRLISLRTGESAEVIKETLNTAIDVIVEEIKEGGSVSLLGFGTFCVGRRKERNFCDPHSKKLMHAEEAKVARFIPGKPLKYAASHSLKEFPKAL